MVYTDKVHLVADTIEELHNFANTIGLKRHFFEGVKKNHPHYDLIYKSRKPVCDEAGNQMIDKAILNGAIVVGNKKIVEISHKSIKKQ